jgi:two-component system response regulator NreC
MVQPTISRRTQAIIGANDRGGIRVRQASELRETRDPSRRATLYGAVPVTGAGSEGETTIKIVLADDHAVVRTGLRMLLNGEPGLEVVAEAGNTEDAARYVRGHHPQVLVLDLNMPGESGLELIPRLTEEIPATKIVVLTMQRDPAFARQALSSGALGYVIKDAADAELVQAVRSAAAGQHYINPQLGARLAATPPDARPGDLTEREVEVLRLIALGHTNPEIASQLYLSIRTIETHRAHIHQKLNLATRADLVRFAIDHRLIDLPGAAT